MREYIIHLFESARRTWNTESELVSPLPLPFSAFHQSATLRAGYAVINQSRSVVASSHS
jgi:hypothetical protein